MNHAITVELQFFLISILWGGILLLVYDGLRILRRLINHDSFFLAVEDLIFWVAASLFIFAMMYKQNNGIIRGFSVIGMAIGMVLYHYILSDILVNSITKLIRTLLRPFAIALKQVKRFFKFLLSRGNKVVNFLFLQLKKSMKSVRIALNIWKQARNVKKQKHREQVVLEKNKKNEKQQVRQKQKEAPKRKADQNLKSGK